MFKKRLLLGMVILLVVGMLFAQGAKEEKRRSSDGCGFLRQWET